MQIHISLGNNAQNSVDRFNSASLIARQTFFDTLQSDIAFVLGIDVQNVILPAPQVEAIVASPFIDENNSDTENATLSNNHSNT
jgi:hypothetical protein